MAEQQTQALAPFEGRARELRENIGEHDPVAIVPRTFAEVQAFAVAISQSSLIPKSLQDNAADVAMMILAGAEIRVPPVASLRVFHVIEGVPKLSADGIAAICTRDAMCEYVEPRAQSSESVTWAAKRRGRPEVTLTVTREDMKLAGLWERKNRDGSPGNHQKYPRQMLNARCKAELCRMVFPEICAGMLSAEEARDIDAIDAEFVEVPASNFAPLPKTESTPALAANEEKPTEPAKRASYSDEDVVDIIADITQAKGAPAINAAIAGVDKKILTDAQYEQVKNAFTEALRKAREGATS